MFLDRHLHGASRFPVHGSPFWLLGLIFVAGLAVGTAIPGQDRLPWRGPSAASSIPPATHPAAPAGPAPWSRDGHAGVRHSVDVVRVIDGDTFEARVHLWPGLEMMTRVRLRGIDAPEMKGACAEEFRMAEVAHEALRALLADGDVAIFSIGPDKYNGRVVADAATRHTPSIASALLTSGHVRPYQGGRRSGWCTSAMR